jgi:hypothetical protein
MQKINVPATFRGAVAIGLLDYTWRRRKRFIA